MIELIQFPWSPFCIVQTAHLGIFRRALQNHKHPQSGPLAGLETHEAALLRRARSFATASNVIFEVADDSQVIAKYLDEELELDFFPRWRGVQSVLWRFIENEIEGATFRLNDIYWKENVPPAEQLQFLRFKERKFGRGCIDQWRKDQKIWLKRLEELLVPFEIILTHQKFLLDDQPRFVDFDLFGMLGNFLYSGHYKLPARHKQIQKWHRRDIKKQK
jgi:glutathione S-transferase